MKSIFSKIFHLPVYVHFLAVIAASIVAVYGALKYIDRYTNHNQAVLVPDVKGILIEDAIPLLEQNELRYEVIDSIYTDDFMPGAIVELLPEAKAKVKRNRIIYITINAKTEKMTPVPVVMDSYRQVHADLRMRGFDVERRDVPGEFFDLVVGVEYKGQLVDAGTRIPHKSKLVILVSNGSIEPLEGDTISIGNQGKIGGDDSWF